MIILSTAYLAPIHFYARLYAAHEAVVDIHEHHVKQTYRNRCCIATPQGVLALTVPVVRNKDGRGSICEVGTGDTCIGTHSSRRMSAVLFLSSTPTISNACLTRTSAC